MRKYYTSRNFESCASFSYSKTRYDILGRIELSVWRQRLREPLTSVGHTLSDNWKSCALGERMKKED